MVSGADIMIHGSWDVHPSTQGGDGLQLIIIVAGTTHGTIPGIMATEGVVTTPMAVTQVRPTIGDAAMAATVEALKEEDPMGTSLAIVALQAQCHKATQVSSAVIPYQTEAT